MKKSVVLFLSLVFVFSLALMGCSSDKNTSKDSGKSSSKKVTLTIGSWRTEDKAGYEKIIKDFEAKNPDIQVEFKPSQNTEYDTILNTQLKGGSGPDIIQLRPYAPGMALAKAGYLEPIDGMSGLDQFSKLMLAAATGQDGKVYGVPLSVNSAQIFYNKDIFKKYKIEEPKTYDDLIAIAKKLKKNNVTPFAFGSKDAWLLTMSHAIIGPAFYGSDFPEKVKSGQAKFTDPDFVKSIQAMKDLDAYFPKNYTGLGEVDDRTLFATGQAAMYVEGSFDIEPVRQLNPDIKLGFFNMPSAKGGDPTITTWVDSSYGINAKSAHKEEAKKFIEYLTTKEFGKLFADTFNRISAVPGVETKDALVTALAQASDKYATPYFILTDFNDGNPTTKTVLTNDLQAMYLGKMTPEDVAKDVQKSADTWFKPAQ